MSNAWRIFTDLAAGAMAGATAKTAIAPLDRTKIYFQTHPDRSYRIKGAIKFLRLTYERDGVVSLWRGNSATMARIVPYAAIQFMAHEQYKRVLGVNHPLSNKKPDMRNFLAGSLAGMTGQSLTYPLDRARAVMAVTRMGQYKNLGAVFAHIVKEEGPQGLYRGFAPTMIGVVMYAGTSFFFYETLKHFWVSQHRRRQQEDGREEKSMDSSRPKAYQLFVSGAAAGLFGQTTSYPLDIVRRRMQTARQMGVPYERYSTILGTLWVVYHREGIVRGWYKGLSMNFVKGPIATGISFTTFDYFQLGLRRLLIVSLSGGGEE